MDDDANLAPHLRDITEKIYLRFEQRLRRTKSLGPKNTVIKDLLRQDLLVQEDLAFIVATSMGYSPRSFQQLYMPIRETLPTLDSPGSPRCFRFIMNELTFAFPPKKGSDQTRRQETLWKVPDDVAPILIIYYGAIRPFLIRVLQLGTVTASDVRDSGALEGLRIHPFVHAQLLRGMVGRPWQAKRLNAALESVIRRIESRAGQLISNVDGKLLRQIFQVTIRKHLPAIAGGLPGSSRRRQEAADTPSTIADTLTASAGHTANTETMNYGRLADGQPHPSQTMSTGRIVQFIDVSRAWQWWLGIGDITDDFLRQYNMTLPLASAEWCNQVAFDRARHLARLIMGGLNADDAKQKLAYLDDKTPFLRGLAVSRLSVINIKFTL